MSKSSSIYIEQLDHSNLSKLLDFLNANSNLRNDYFYPHPFTQDYLIYLLINRTRDYYSMILLDGKVVAYGILRGWDEGYQTPSLGVAVDKDYRGQGLATLMCHYLHQVAKVRGCERVRLRVIKGNDKAKALYEKLGYVFKDFDEEHEEGILRL